MGLYDTVLLLDDLPAAACPHGHLMRSFQSKDLEHPSMLTYLVHGRRLYRAWPRHGLGEEKDPAAWRLHGSEAVHELRHELIEVVPCGPVRVYGRCERCEPILVRSDPAGAGIFGDIVREHALIVDLRLTFRYGEPVQVERLTGSRDDMRSDLSSRGLHVLTDDEPLAVAHRELRRARDATWSAGRSMASWP